MKTIRFDSLGGASGDMILASLIDLGADPDALQQALQELPIEEFRIRHESVTAGGLRGTRVHIDVAQGQQHPHRRLADIRAMLEVASLPAAVTETALEVFQRLAEAEAAVHGTTPEEIHFHEVGAMDSIIDIVASCAALHQLDVESVDVGILPLGHGTVTCEHGTLPVPVPATVELLKGHPVQSTDQPFELVTPTGAALLMTWHARAAAPSAGILERAGNGIGHRELNGRMNLLRALLYDSQAADTATDQCLVLECNLDDTIPELIGALTSTLLESGALDTFTTAVQMKKQRPGTLLTVLCKPENREKLLELIFRESTTFGIREYMTHRTLLDRRHVEVETPYGKVRVKTGSWHGCEITRAPEHDDCRRCADAAGVPVRTVYESAVRG